MLKNIIYTSLQILALVALSGDILYAQQDMEIPVSSEIRSEQQITMLQNGALIVRLRSESRSMKAYLDNGLNKEAEQLQKALDKENRIIMNAFKGYFNFCDLLFMYQSDHDRIAKGEKKGYFLDSTLRANDSIVLNSNDYLFVEISEVYASTLQVNANYTSLADRENVDLNATPIKYDCLVIKNKELVQLSRPFPFYVTTPMRLSKVRYAVKKLNANLHRYFQHVKAKQPANY